MSLVKFRCRSGFRFRFRSKNEGNVPVKFRTGTTGTTGTTGIPLVPVPVPVVFDRNVNRGTTNQEIMRASFFVKISGNRIIQKSSSYRDESHVVDSSRGTLSSSVFIFFIEILVVSLASSKVRVRFMAPKTATEKSTFIYKTFKKPPKILRPVSFVALHLLYPMMPSPFS